MGGQTEKQDRITIALTKTWPGPDRADPKRTLRVNRLESFAPNNYY